jgi:hypothetical protein
MKSKYYITIALLNVLGLLSACSESEVPLYSGEAGIYFNNRTSTANLVDSTSVTFIYSEDDFMDIPVAIQTFGRLADFDRPVNLEVTSDNAQQDVDYQLLTPAVVPANVSEFTYTVRLLKTPSLSNETKVIRLKIGPNSYFSNRYPHELVGNDTVTTLEYRIFFTNQFTVAPAGWNTMFGGTFSVYKLDLLCKLFPEIPRADYNVANKITLAKWSYMQVNVSQYVWQQVQNKAMQIAYDKDAFDPDGNALDFTK